MTLSYDFYLWALVYTGRVGGGWTPGWVLRQWTLSGMVMILGIKGQLPSCPVAQVACHSLSTLSPMAEPWKAALPGNLRSSWLQLPPPGESASWGQSLPADFQGT